jgi:hypothetical protein
MCSLICAAILTGSASVQADPVDRYVDAINTPQLTTSVDEDGVILIAIIDDGFRVSHQDIRDFIWTNPGEKPDNRIDDDGNGFVDDVHGWDVSDADNDVNVPDDRPDFYHGTHIAGIVAEVARTAFGDAAPARIRILPIKAIADSESSTYIKDGYDGVQYAIRAGADIIICSWGVAHITREEADILQEASDNGVIVVASAGNLPQELEQFPAAFSSVLAVGSVEMDGSKTYNSNYGQFVDIAAPGSNIRSAAIEADDAYAVRSGTSFSTAMVAAAAALIRQGRPSLSISEVEACLLSSSTPIDLPSREFSAKLGAGVLDIQAAFACELLTDDRTTEHHLNRSKGYLHAVTKSGRSVSWVIRPPGEFSGIRFTATGDRKQVPKGRVEFRAGPALDSDLVASYALNELPDSVFVPGTAAHVSLDSRKWRRSPDWLMRYEAEAINFSELFCRGTPRTRIRQRATANG